MLSFEPEDLLVAASELAHQLRAAARWDERRRGCDELVLHELYSLEEYLDDLRSALDEFRDTARAASGLAGRLHARLSEYHCTAGEEAEEREREEREEREEPVDTTSLVPSAA